MKKITVELGPTLKGCPPYWRNFIDYCRYQTNEQLDLNGIPKNNLDKFNLIVKKIFHKELDKYHGKFIYITKDDDDNNDDKKAPEKYATLEFDSESAYTLFVLKWSFP